MIFWSAIASSLHLLSLGLGWPAVLLRARAFAELASAPDNERWQHWLLWSDNCWGLISLCWLGSGLWRLFGGLAKPLAWYQPYGVFWLKMGLIGLLAVLELLPMIALLRARFALQQGQWQPRPQDLRRDARLSLAEGALIPVIVLVAALMTRGWHYPGH
jgi:uncharacterized membrane protein